jgi:hypothetical protein
VTEEREVFISVDVATAGPISGEYSLLSIGACNVDDRASTFCVRAEAAQPGELLPQPRGATPQPLRHRSFRNSEPGPGTCWHLYVKGYTPMVNCIYNGLRMEDVWLDK